MEGFREAFKGSFLSMLRWHNLDDFWSVMREHADEQWYIYAIGEAPPSDVSSAEEVTTFITEIDIVLHRDHGEDYCGIVFVDDPVKPSFVKIFDPHNLGVSCGFSDNPPLPGWILSKLAPVDLEAPMPLPGNRKRWWSRLFA